MAIEITPQINDFADQAKDQLNKRGYALFRAAGASSAGRIANDLGRVVKTTDVEVDTNSSNLVTAARELDFHTDHAAVDYIAWGCVRQTDEGGISRLVDGLAVLQTLAVHHQVELENVFMTEHRIFEDDPGRRSMVRYEKGRKKLYYSFWLLEDELTDAQRDALDAYRDALAQADAIEIRLEPGDVLVIDNTRMLHGRTEISGNQDRLLQRYWVRRDADDASNRIVTGELELPDPISEERIRELIARGVDPDVAAIDLSMVKMKLQEEDEGKGWSRTECEEAELEYKRYLTLNIRYEERAIVPTKQIDDFWHYHILDTRAYHRDCQEVFGEYFHHFPYFGMRGEEDADNLERSFMETVELYEREFGQAMLRNNAEARDCWHDCQGRCWHACSND
jgi:hypothetical protein